MIGIASIIDIKSPEWRENPVACLIKLEEEGQALDRFNHLDSIVVCIGEKNM